MVGMLSRLPSRPPLLALICGLAAALTTLLLGGCGDAQPAHATGAAPVVKVSSTPVGPAVPRGFLGMSMEYRALEAYAGTDPHALDGPFVQILRNLAPAGGLILRIGGDSTDWAWWPVPHVARPGGVRFAIGPHFSAVARAVASATAGQLILGIQFEADNRAVAAYEARELLAHVGPASVAALELGNEPELYPSFPWYKSASGHHVYGRPPSYTASSLITDFANIAAGLPHAPVAGPSAGGPKYLASLLGGFTAHESRLGLVTVHAYPLKHCSRTHFASPSDFFLGASLQGLANMIGGWTSTAHAHHLPLRVDEMNSISCGGQKGLSQSFAPALWALDMLPRIVRAGVQGVNFHTVPGTNQALIAATHARSGWQVTVEPEYYGLLAFTQAAPAGSRLLRLSNSSVGPVDIWAARATSGQVHVVLVNHGTRAQSLHLAVAGPSGTATAGALSAPSLGATSRVTLTGQRIARSTGLLAGRPATSSIEDTGGTYPVTVAPHSATILTVG
jgi:hypothetical protein